MSPRMRLPYPGLRPFTREESDLFFGREGYVDDMVDRLAQTRFLAVLGASGTGKSSLVITGLLDALELGLDARAGSRWKIAYMRPGSQPIRNLAHALLKKTTEQGQTDDQADRSGAGSDLNIELLTAYLTRGPRSIAEWCCDGHLASGWNLLILVDQFEELFRYGDYAGREEAEAFVALLLESSQSSDVPVHVVVTMRSEYLGACALIPGLAESINAGLYLTPRMTRAEVREAIEGPARVCGFSLEPALVNRLLNDLSSFAPWEDDPSSDQLQQLSRRADQLPLMQHVLNQLWMGAVAGAETGPVRLRLADYERIGGLRGALDAHAHAVFESLSEQDRPVAESVFRALVSGTSLSNAVRRPCQFDQLVNLAQGNRPAVERVIDAFRAPDCNFLTPPAHVRLDDRRVVDISHESLIRQWSLLSEWFDKESRAAARWRTLVAATESHSRDEGGLLRELDLANSSAWWAREAPNAAWAIRYGNLFEDVKRFLNLSQTTEEDRIAREQAREGRERRRLRKSRALFAGLSAVVFVLFIVAYIKGEEARIKGEEARHAAERANWGFGVAFQAATSLGQNAGTSGSNIEAVMQDADRMLKDVAVESVDPGVDPGVVEKRAELLLSFASTSERLGNYTQQHERVMTARSILAPICERTKAPSCLNILASTYEEEGDYLLKERKEDAIAAYEQALERRKPLAGEGADNDYLLAQARTEAALSRALVEVQRAADGLKMAANCRDTVQRTAVDDAAVQLAKAVCQLREASALRGVSKPEEAIRSATETLSLLRAVTEKSPQEIESAEQMARTYQELAYLFWAQGNRAEAVTHFEKAVGLLQPLARSNPQNDQIADLLAELLGMQASAYGQTDRKDLAAHALETRVELARTRRGASRESYWKTVELESLNNLSYRYEALGRHRDALETAETEVRLRLERVNQPTGAAPLPADILSAMINAAEEAIKIADGVKAYEYLSQTLDHSEQQLALARAAGRDPGTIYSQFSNFSYRAIDRLARITAPMLPQERRVAVLEAIAGHVSRYAMEEPRIIPFRRAERRSRYQLAVALELADHLARAREMHERASKAGWRTSTIVLSRWYLEGFAGTTRDHKRAMELEALAASQIDLPTWDIQVRYRSNNSTSEEPLYFKESDSGGDPMADEMYRLARYENAEITDEGRQLIGRIYELARENKLTVAKFIESQKDYIRKAVDLPTTAVSSEIQALRKSLKEKKLQEAFDHVAVAVRGLKDPKKGTDRSNLMARGEIADVSVELEQAAEAAKNSQLVQRAVQLGEQAIAIILAVDIEGSSPRMSLATDLERLARRAGNIGQFDYSVRLYRRAIELRDLVRAKDPSNAECQCGIARDYSAIGEIEKGRKKLDDAMVAYQRALYIYEELQKLEPETGWNIRIAETARTLAEVLGERGEERSALLHAQMAASVYGEYASRHSAESTTRIEYAKALELVSQFARAVANSEKPSDTKSAEEHFELSVSNRLEANAIRESVLAVDPSNGECRCQVGSNLQEIASIYSDWGKKDKWLQTLSRAVQENRQELKKQPSQPRWQYNLAKSLWNRANATDKANYQAVVQDVKEASNLFRALVKDFPDAKDMLMYCLINISFNALFLERDQEALAAAEEGRTIDPDNLIIETNRAHALMFLGRADEAYRLYLANKGKAIESSTWDKEIANDFDALKAVGRTRPLMDRVLKHLNPT